MKTYNDLEFENRSIGFNLFGLGDGRRAYIEFDNGYGVSVVDGEGTYCDNDGSNFELAVMCDGEIIYTTPVTCNVLGYQTPQTITEIMAENTILYEESILIF